MTIAAEHPVDLLDGRHAVTAHALAAGTIACVGSIVGVSTTIADAPVSTLQAVRYALAAALLLGLTRAAMRPQSKPRGVDWLWLVVRNAYRPMLRRCIEFGSVGRGRFCR